MLRAWTSRSPDGHQATGKAAPLAANGHPPRPGRDAGSALPPGFHSYFTNQKQKVNGAGLTTYFPGALGDQLSQAG